MPYFNHISKLSCQGTAVWRVQNRSYLERIEPSCSEKRFERVWHCAGIQCRDSNPCATVENNPSLRKDRKWQYYYHLGGFIDCALIVVTVSCGYSQHGGSTSSSHALNISSALRNPGHRIKISVCSSSFPFLQHKTYSPSYSL
jgi:ribosomal protein L31